MSFLSDVGIEDVPWFSKSEWLEVYKCVFSNKYEDYVTAYNHICVWKVRVMKLPVGIECTIPLLNAQIALKKQSLDSSLKASVLNMAILRFVSVVTKSYEYRHSVGKKMHDLAAKMNLPLYLIDLRNQIIHSDNIFGSTETYRAALDICFQWIQVNYWKKQEKEFRSRPDLPANPIVIKKSLTNTNSHKKASSTKLRLLTEKRVLLFASNCGRIEDKIKMKKLENALNEEIISYSVSENEDSMNILVSDLFLSPKLIAWLDQNKNSEERKCKCSKHQLSAVFKYLAPHLFLIIEIRHINILIKTLIGDGNDTDAEPTRRKWLRFLVNICLNESRERKLFLKANGIDLWKFSKLFDWKEHVYTLFSLGKKWSITLANYIHENDLVKIDLYTSQKIKTLVKLYRKGFETSNSPKTIDLISKSYILKECSDIETLESLTRKSQKISKNAFDYVTEVCSQVKEDPENKIRGEEIYLGLLPHQVGDQYYYKKLILPEIPLDNNE